MKKYKYALFDWDGCLSDTLSNAKRIIMKLAAQKGVKMELPEVREILGDWEKSAKKMGYESVEQLKME